MKEGERKHLVGEELQEGNVVLFDHKEFRGEPCMPGIVANVSEGLIYFKGDLKRKIEDCAPILIDDKWLLSYGVSKGSLPEEIKFVHQLQNLLGEPKNNQKECMSCGKPWGWNDKDVFDFNIAVGKRIWPALCNECRTELEDRYRSKKITYTQLMLVFSDISSRISKKCAVQGSVAVEKLKNFAPQRRGKH